MDIAVVQAPEHDGLDIVSLADIKKHYRFPASSTALNDQFEAAVREAADKLHGKDGELNRTLFPMTWRLYLKAFPASGVIQLPYPPLLEVSSIAYEDAAGSSPQAEVDPSTYVVCKDKLIGTVELKPGQKWPTAIAHPRAVAVTYRAGYEEYPHNLKRLIKILAAHYMNFPEAAVAETRAMFNRRVEFGVDSLRNALRVPHAYDDWE